MPWDEVLGLKSIDMEKGVLTVPSRPRRPNGFATNCGARGSRRGRSYSLLSNARSSSPGSGLQPWIVDHVVLGHARPKLLRIYMPTLPVKEASEALQKWGEELDRILGAELSAESEDAAVSGGVS
jgi:hypothetical protein